MIVWYLICPGIERFRARKALARKIHRLQDLLIRESRQLTVVQPPDRIIHIHNTQQQIVRGGNPVGAIAVRPRKIDFAGRSKAAGNADLRDLRNMDELAALIHLDVLIVHVVLAGAIVLPGRTVSGNPSGHAIGIKLDRIAVFSCQTACAVSRDGGNQQPVLEGPGDVIGFKGHTGGLVLIDFRVLFRLPILFVGNIIVKIGVIAVITAGTRLLPTVRVTVVPKGQ